MNSIVQLLPDNVGAWRLS